MTNDCFISIDSCLRLEYPGVIWRIDTILEFPILVGPVNDRAYCLEAIADDSESPMASDSDDELAFTLANTQICLEWLPVNGANVYLLQWSLDSSFSGPSVREKVLENGATSYCLQYPYDIRQQEEIYWRVQAANNITGGYSARSETRKISFNCSDGQNQDEPTLCDQYAVRAEIKGRTELSCCETGVYWLEIAADCLDLDGNLLLEIRNVDWSISGDSSAAEIVAFEDGGIFKTKVTICSQELKNIELSAEITYVEHTGRVFTCPVRGVRILVDCFDESLQAVSLKPEFKQRPISNLRNNGEELTVDLGQGCTPCCPTPTPITVNNTESELIGRFRSLSFNPDTCELIYSSSVEFLEDDVVSFVSVSKGEGKSIQVTDFSIAPSFEDDEAWVYRKEPGTTLRIFTSYRGCWREASEPWFTYTFNLDQEPTEPEVNELGFFLECPLTDIVRPKETIATVAGPTFAVQELNLLDEPWPACEETEFVCPLGKIELKIADGWVEIPFTGNLDEPVILEDLPRLNLDCLCECCEDGYYSAQVTNISHDDDIDFSTYSISLTLFCRDCDGLTEIETIETSIGFNCATNIDLNPNQQLLLPEDFLREKDLVVNAQIRECNANIRARAVLGSYNDSERPCTNVQENFNLAITVGGDSSVIENIRRVNGVWVIPRILNSDEEVELGGSKYRLEGIRFDGCNLIADMAKYSAQCTACNPIGCDCGGITNVAPAVINTIVTLDFNLPDPPQIPVQFNVQCSDNTYISDNFIINHPNSCPTVGFLRINNQGVLLFEGRNSLGQTILEAADNFSVDCTEFQGRIIVPSMCSGSSATSNTRVLVEYDSSEHDPMELDCDCESASFEFEIQKCFPLEAVSEIALPPDEENPPALAGTKLEIGNTQLEGECGCISSDSLEARVDIPLDCSLQISEKDDRKYIGIDHETLVGRDKITNSLEVDDSGCCPSIRIPICECVDFERIDLNNEIRVLERAYLHQNTLYTVRSRTQIPDKGFGDVEILKYSDLNPGYIPNVRALNLTGENIGRDTRAVLTVTEDCQLILTLVGTDGEDFIEPSHEVMVIEDVPQGSIAVLPRCEGTCRFEWEALTGELLWTEVENNCADIYNCTGNCDCLCKETRTAGTDDYTYDWECSNNCNSDDSDRECGCDTGNLICDENNVGLSPQTFPCNSTPEPIDEPNNGTKINIVCESDRTCEFQCTIGGLVRVSSNCAEGQNCPDLEGSPCLEIGAFQTATCEGDDPNTTEEPIDEGCFYECDGQGFFINPPVENCPDGFECPSTDDLVCVNETVQRDCVRIQDCKCVPPTFCGSERGQCTVTSCSREVTQVELNCGDEDALLCCVAGQSVPYTDNADCCSQMGVLSLDCTINAPEPEEDLTGNCTLGTCICTGGFEDGTLVEPCDNCGPDSFCVCDGFGSNVFGTFSCDGPREGTCVEYIPATCVGGCNYFWEPFGRTWSLSDDCEFLGGNFIPEGTRCECSQIEPPTEPGPDTECSSVGFPCGDREFTNPCQENQCDIAECRFEAREIPTEDPDDEQFYRWFKVSDDCPEDDPNCEGCGAPLGTPQDICQVAVTRCVGGFDDSGSCCATFSTPGAASFCLDGPLSEQQCEDEMENMFQNNLDILTASIVIDCGDCQQCDLNCAAGEEETFYDSTGLTTFPTSGPAGTNDYPAGICKCCPENLDGSDATIDPATGNCVTTEETGNCCFSISTTLNSSDLEPGAVSASICDANFIQNLTQCNADAQLLIDGIPSFEDSEIATSFVVQDCGDCETCPGLGDCGPGETLNIFNSRPLPIFPTNDPTAIGNNANLFPTGICRCCPDAEDADGNPIPGFIEEETGNCATTPERGNCCFSAFNPIPGPFSVGVQPAQSSINGNFTLEECQQEVENLLPGAASISHRLSEAGDGCDICEGITCESDERLLFLDTSGIAVFPPDNPSGNNAFPTGLCRCCPDGPNGEEGNIDPQTGLCFDFTPPVCEPAYDSSLIPDEVFDDPNYCILGDSTSVFMGGGQPTCEDFDSLALITEVGNIHNCLGGFELVPTGGFIDCVNASGTPGCHQVFVAVGSACPNCPD